MPRPRKSNAIAERWNGKIWIKVAVPVVTARPGWSAAVGGSGVATGPGDFWAFISLGSKSGCCLLGSLLHLQNGKWHRISLPSYVMTGGQLTQDGHGGIWIIGNKGAQGWLAHYQGGHWSRTPDPVPHGEFMGVGNLTWITGTSSVWASMFVEPNDDPHESGWWSMTYTSWRGARGPAGARNCRPGL